MKIGSAGTLILNDNQAGNNVLNVNNAFTGTGLLKYIFSDTTATNTYTTNINGFNGTIELANTTTTNKDKLSLGYNGVSGVTINAPNTAVIIDNGSTLFTSTNAVTLGSIQVTGTGNAETAVPSAFKARA